MLKQRDINRQTVSRNIINFEDAEKVVGYLNMFQPDCDFISGLAHAHAEAVQSNYYDWIGIIVIISIVESWSGSKLDRFTDRLWYSMNSNATWQNVDIQRRPTDCDFLHAPIGSKRCWYY